MGPAAQVKVGQCRNSTEFPTLLDHGEGVSRYPQVPQCKTGTGTPATLAPARIVSLGTAGPGAGAKKEGAVDRPQHVCALGCILRNVGGDLGVAQVLPSRVVVDDGPEIELLPQAAGCIPWRSEQSGGKTRANLATSSIASHSASTVAPAGEAFQVLKAAACSTTGPTVTVPRLQITSVRLGAAVFVTDRGRVIAPAWLFSFRDLPDPASVLAVVAGDSALQLLTQWIMMRRCTKMLVTNPVSLSRVGGGTPRQPDRAPFPGPSFFVGRCRLVSGQATRSLPSTATAPLS